MTIARPHAGETLNRVESTTRTNGRCSARASAVDVSESRRSGAGSVVMARGTPATSASVGVRTVGAAVPILGVAPGSSTASGVDPTRSFAFTTSRHAPGVGIARVATYDTRSRPGGRTGIASTAAPVSAPSDETSWTAGRSARSSIRAPSRDKVRITGAGGPAQTDVETTSTARLSGPALEAAGIAGALDAAVASGGSDAEFDAVPGGVLSIARRTAVIASDEVPKGNVARRIPDASTRKTSAVCDIEYA